MPPSYAEEIAYGIVVLIITFVSLIVGELIPKRVALLHAETLALRVAPIMRLFATSLRRSSGCCACRSMRS